MFPHQQMAVGLMPRASLYSPIHCNICTWTCCDTGHSVICFAAYSGGGCGQLSPVEAVAAPVQSGDPIEHLQELRKRLEAALAGAEAHENALRKQREGGADQNK